MQTVTHAVVQEVINNTGLSWVNAVAWCDNNLPSWCTSEPVTAEVIKVMWNYEDEAMIMNAMRIVE